MNRRELFKLLGLGLIGTVAAKFLPGQYAHRAHPMKIHPLPPPPSPGPWRMIAYREPEFRDERLRSDHGEYIGWHYDDRWRASAYGGYEALGYGAVDVRSM